MRRVHAIILSLLLLSLSACALLPNRDPLNINVVGIEPLQSQGMEIRFAVKIRVQNPNDSSIDYNGVALDLEVNGQPLASGVSDQSGSIARFSETVLTVPVSVSAFSVLRQTLGLSQTQSLNDLPYVLRGKLAGGLFGTMRFTDTGKLSLPGAAAIPRQTPQS
ncbi:MULTISPECIES: LEA type 2 family protein [Pseudomonas]|jgi:LEA14-like dessication related protein|uniref:LEA type 2 family protein n=1 Tax=Pseudomonas TaxID=286 RepID=UPI000486C90D|nr:MULTISPECIES: LEA type 2 family protein [Pseudomonas]MBF6039052.1 LEA type 2 family protein [Pseudomonas mucoides]CRL47025.1 Late embryogenesis abundant protein [Pseudomonas sp. URMO17WK12:I11]